MTNKLNHLAVIMDGNARWAAKNGHTKAFGHKQGAEAAKNLVKNASALGIEYVTLYAFSSENWTRPESEISMLLDLLGYYIKNEIKNFEKNQIRLKVIGDLNKLSQSLQEKINETIEATKNYSKLTLTIAFSYGSRDEILQACQKAIDSGAKKITEENFKNFLYDPEMPDVDLLIRTSGVYRISNFLLWQAAYAELYFTDKFWPDFDKEDLLQAIENYSKRKRNFGGRDE
jgi:undecaprenyl diphosphate synthase